MTLSRFPQFYLLIVTMLQLLATMATASDDAIESCLVGTTRLLECSSLGVGSSASATLQSFASPNCDYLFTVIWGPISEGIFVNGTDLVDKNSNDGSSLSYALLEYEYDTPGVYDLSISIRGFPNISNYYGNNLLEEDWQIQVDRDDWFQITIAPDRTCVDTTFSGATLAEFTMTCLVASVLSLFWLVI